jgi:hypothetical protein
LRKNGALPLYVFVRQKPASGQVGVILTVLLFVLWVGANMWHIGKVCQLPIPYFGS